ncbi:hypothetical protein FPZ42_02245 [Mucilaginibacter achroorhodeus]|uniref:Uncharacterized protein n=1 Tax=Mucilaginibacter achroorhodeus TaxID=2599294 RepID=A0A563U9J7_9SPHI|nr:hypothetical protein [Mucilaginibacter achroorhodeus]TWR28057.1 hypothetical protein FPZ42_02245 [Mucilaginibacter achroorhodeus]
MKSTLNLFKLLSIASILVLQSCSQEIGVWKNDKIAKSEREELHELNDAVFKTVSENDVKKFGSYLTNELLKDNYSNKLFSQLYGTTRKDSFKLADDFYVINKYIDSDTIKVANGINSYKLIYNGDPQEMYIATFLPKSRTPNQSMITLIYGHYNYGWKIKDVDVAPYTINGKTAPELYQQAKLAYRAQNLFAAANTLQLLQSCSRPNNAWQYDSEAEMYSFAGEVINKVNEGYKFPLKLTSVDGAPTIIRLYHTTFNDGTFPNICYITKKNLKDVNAVEWENAEIRKTINTLLPGVEKNSPYIVYSAYNEMPSQNAVREHYDMKVKGL